MRQLSKCPVLLLATIVIVHAAAVTHGNDFDDKDSYHGHFTNDFAVEVNGNSDVADLVAETHGFRLVKQLHGLGEVYHFIHEDTSARSKRSAEDLVKRLAGDPNVKNVEQQRILRRTKRKIVHDKQSELPIRFYDDKSVYQRFFNKDGDENRTGSRTGKSDIPQARWVNQMDFNDPYYRDQWYYDNKGQTGGTVGMDVNVIPVWKKGLTGKGIVVTILDDGIDHTHPDLRENYMAEASADLNDYHDNDPMPDVSNEDNSHGTRCAGEIAAKANNNNCGVGIAYNANIGGVRMLDGIVTDLLESEAISFKRDLIDIYSASWGPADNGKTMETPGSYCKRALEEGVKKGRGGKGSIFVWATGNGGMVDDDCSCDGYVSSIETLSIGCISDQGLSTYFSEVCPSTMAVITTGGSHAQPGMRDYQNPKVKVVTTDLHGDCTLEFQGTSSAAPMAAGAFALVLEANPELTWRDMQHLVARTARVPNAEEEGWMLNGAGLHVNHRFGFGVIDVGRMVETAQTWTNVGPQKKCQVPSGNSESEIAGTLTQTLTTDACVSDQDSYVNKLEHVQAFVEIEHPRRGDLQLTLISPSGTKSQILSTRPLDNSNEGIHFKFMTVHNWGENPAGEWKLEVTDNGVTNKRGTARGALKSWSLTLWGTQEESSTHNKGKVSDRSPQESQAHSAEQSEINAVMGKEENQANHLKIHYHKERNQLEEDEKNILDELIEGLVEDLETKEDKRDKSGIDLKKKSKIADPVAAKRYQPDYVGKNYADYYRNYNKNKREKLDESSKEENEDLNRMVAEIKRILEEMDEES